MAAEVKVTFPDRNATIERAKKRFIRLAKQLGDMRPVWKDYINYHTQVLIPKTFKSRGVVMMGGRWPQYTQSSRRKMTSGELRRFERQTGLSAQSGKTKFSRYLVWKKKKVGNKPMMRFSDDLYEAARGGSGWFQKPRKKMLSIGLDSIKYAAAHQYGYKKNNLPQRAYFFTKDEDLPIRAWAFLIKNVDARLEGAFENDK